MGDNAASPATERRPAEDGTAYWTLSFYISRPQIIGHDLAMPVKPDACRRESAGDDRDALAEDFDLAHYFVRHPDWAAKGGTRTLDDLRELEPFDSRKAVKAGDALDRQKERTAALRGAINPLFNDIADRSRLGRIEDQLFAVAPARDATFVLPDLVRWSTEGRTYAVPVAAEEARFAIHVTRFWYLHGNGAMSWHISFEVNYRNAGFEAALAAKRVPTGLYLLSLMQKLAYPKESEMRPGQCAPGEQAAGCRSDELFELRLIDPAMGPADQPQLFWDVVDHWFEDDKATISAVHARNMQDVELLGLCPHIVINEIPGLFCLDTRSNFFLRDEAFFKLIQPKDADGALENRRMRVRDELFAGYPALIDAHAVTVPDPRDPQREVTLLGKEYWAKMLSPGAGWSKGRERAGKGPAERLFYLFLAGFNQNIIDWTNQDASEVLDSLDPIYPNSDEQLNEGFFIRYANPRCLITYVQRSRTLEVGNDFIGTCPYAFLIHVLAMHNERLTRDQEKLAFAVVEKVNSFLRAAQAGGHEPEEAGRLVRQAEEWINWYRIAAFEHFDRHRYFNPFRYDTERDVFTELERLRGTSRLAAALDKALAALDESTRDIQRVREDAEADRRQAEADKAEEQNRFMSLVFGFVGLAGLAQVVLQIDQLMLEQGSQFGWSRVIADIVITFVIAGLIAIAIRAFPNAAYLFRK